MRGYTGRLLLSQIALAHDLAHDRYGSSWVDALHPASVGKIGATAVDHGLRVSDRVCA
jgi:hypothetical protein